MKEFTKETSGIVIKDIAMNDIQLIAVPSGYTLRATAIGDLLPDEVQTVYRCCTGLDGTIHFTVQRKSNFDSVLSVVLNKVTDLTNAALEQDMHPMQRMMMRGVMDRAYDEIITALRQSTETVDELLYKRDDAKFSDIIGCWSKQENSQFNDIIPGIGDPFVDLTNAFINQYMSVYQDYQYIDALIVPGAIVITPENAVLN